MELALIFPVLSKKRKRLFQRRNKIFILPSSFWQAFFAPKEHPKIVDPQFQLRVNATKKQSPAGATDKTVAGNSAAPPGLADFHRIKPAVETAGHSHPSPRDCAANPKKDSAANHANQHELNRRK